MTQHMEHADSHHPLDKSVLVPLKEGYLDVRPKTPAYLPMAMKKAIFAVAASVMSASVRAQAKELANPNTRLSWPVASFRARSWRMPKAQNFSFYTNTLGGQVFHTLFLPPPLHRPESSLLRRLAKEWNEEGFHPGLLRPALSGLAEKAGTPLRIARQKHRHKVDLEIKDMAAIDNMATREAFVDLGHYAGMVSLEALEAIPLEYGSAADQERKQLIKDHANTGLVSHAWNMVSRELAENYGLLDEAGRNKGFELFSKGFSEVFWFGKELEPDGHSEPGRRPASQHAPRPQAGGRFLVISMRVDAHDAGTAGPSLGVPAPTAMFGFLHRVVERESGLRMRRFMPVIHSCRIQDQLAQRHGVRIKLAEETKNLIIKDAQPQKLETLRLTENDLVIYPDEMPYSITGKASPVHAVSYDKAVTPPFQNEIKASTSLSLVIELESFIPAEAARTTIDVLMKAIRKSHLAGGTIHDLQARIHEEKPRYLRGFVLVRHKPSTPNPLHELFQSVAFVDRNYAGRWPIGFLACGYEGIQTAGTISRKGQSYPAQHAETIYKGFRFSGAHHPDPVWFELDRRQRGELFDIQLCQ